MIGRKPRPINLWRFKDAKSAYVIGYTGVGDNPLAKEYIASTHIRFAAAIFKPQWPTWDLRGPPFLLWWYSEGLGFFHGIEQVYCGARGRRTDAERDARDWAELAGRGAEDFEMAGVGTFEEFEERTLSGLVIATLRCTPDPIDAEALDLWNYEADAPRNTASPASDNWRWN